MPLAPSHAVPPAISAPAPIVVTGRALPQPRSSKAFAVTLLDRRTLVDDPSRRLDSVLGQVAGFQLFRRSDSTSAHPTSQGASLRALGGSASSRALVVLDGVPQADPFGGWINWPAYDPAALEFVRVVRGGGSVADGPGALAGVIELASLARRGASGSLEGGSGHSVDASSYIGAALGAGLVTLSAQGSAGHGFVPVTRATRGPVDRPAPYAEASARARWLTPVGADTELQLSALGFVDWRNRGVPFTGNRTRGADASVRLVGRGPWQWSASAYVQARDLRSSFASVDPARTTAARVSLQDSVPSTAVGGALEARPRLSGGLELRFGADARRASGRSNELYAYVGGDPTRRRASGGHSDTEGLFADGSWTGGRVTLSGGARLDHWRIADGRLVERLLASGVATRDEHYPARSGWRPTARAGAVVALGPSLSLRSAAYLGWRLPTLNELFRPFRVGQDATAANPLLAPERLRGVDLGLDWQEGGSRLSLTAFANRLDDAIANVTLGHGPGVFPGVGFVAGAYRQRLNAGSVRVAGIELSASTKRGPWSLRVDASLTNPRVRSARVAPALDGLRPAQTPTRALSAALGWATGGRSASLVLRHVGPQYDDDLNRRRLPAATTLGGFAAIPLGRGWQVTARVENLLNARVVAGLGDDGTVERATPRALWLGLRFATDETVE